MWTVWICMFFTVFPGSNTTKQLENKIPGLQAAKAVSVKEGGTCSIKITNMEWQLKTQKTNSPKHNLGRVTEHEPEMQK